MWIQYSLRFAREEAVDSGVVESDQFLMPLVALSSEPSKIKLKLSQKPRIIQNSLCRYTFMRIYADVI